jgi:molecular chaperone GrpE
LDLNPPCPDRLRGDESKVIKRKKAKDEAEGQANSQLEIQPDEQSETKAEDQVLEQAELSLEGEASEDSTGVQDRGEGEDGDESFSMEDELTVRQSELDDIQAKAEEYLDGWQRARAEFANYKKRVQKEREDSRSFITAEILSKYLTVVDDFERALSDRPTGEAAEAWAEGIDMIYRKLKTILEAEGVVEITAKGELFDPNFHEAISFEESDDHNEGEVVDVIQPGYKLGERVIRPAVVRVAK